MLQEGESPKEFLEHTKLELFHDQVFCFTPKGQLIALAARRHARSILPMRCIPPSATVAWAARINGRHAPLVTELENGDEVDIIRSDAQVPPPAWESIAVTGKARAAIRRATRAAMRKQFAGLGREIVEKLLAKQNKPMVAKEIAAAVPRLGHKNVDDAMAAIGRGDLSGYDMLKAMGLTVEASQMREVAAQGHTAKKSDRRMRPRFRCGALSGNTALHDFARKPVRFRASALSASSCRARASRSIRFSPRRWSSSTASPNAGSILPGTAPPRTSTFRRGSMSCILNEVGALAQVTQVIGDQGGNIDELQMMARQGVRDFFDLDILLEVHDARHLNDIIAGLRTKNAVSSVTRATG